MPESARDNPRSKNYAELLTLFIELYGENQGQSAFAQLLASTGYHSNSNTHTEATLDQRAAFLITYGDQVNAAGENPLGTLAAFCKKWLSGVISAVHILPFFPYSSDDGFAVIDYLQVDPRLGSWHDIQAIRQDFQLMFDLVINHTSASHAWFRAFLQGEEPYSRYYLTVDGQPDLSAVTRPRALPLLTEFQTRSGVKQVWTTFSDDQPDLDFTNPQVLLEMMGILKDYIDRGAGFIRLDAIAYLWKEIGTACIHLPQTHRVVRLLREYLDYYAPWVNLITETNVPHQENIAYFGNGRDEAQLVYNFALPPLVLHSFHTGSARILTEWAARLLLPSKEVTFFNFLASHDGIGLTPARGLLSEADISSLVDRSLSHGGSVSQKSNLDGSESPYELNINYFDALSDPNSKEPVTLSIDRFVGAHAIMFSLVGIPGIYFHSLFGSRSWPAGIELTGRKRSINRQKLDRQQLEHELTDLLSIRSKVFTALSRLLKVRQRQPAFDPFGSQSILDFGDGIFACFRAGSDPRNSILCLHNVRPEAIQIEFQCQPIWGMVVPAVVDLVSGDQFYPGDTLQLTLQPYQVSWLGVHK